MSISGEYRIAWISTSAPKVTDRKGAKRLFNGQRRMEMGFSVEKVDRNSNEYWTARLFIAFRRISYMPALIAMTRLAISWPKKGKNYNLLMRKASPRCRSEYNINQTAPNHCASKVDETFPIVFVCAHVPLLASIVIRNNRMPSELEAELRLPWAQTVGNFNKILLSSNDGNWYDGDSHRRFVTIGSTNSFLLS